MSKELHDALAALRPKDWADVPVDDLEIFLRDLFAHAELIANSVPPPPGGTDFLSSQPSRSDVNGARSASEMTNSKVGPPPPAPEHQKLWSSWGKPLKVSAKDNPLGISVYKMAGNDRHGAWFARRSVHEGMGFEKWKRAMMQEFLESLAVQGGPGEGNVRGIGSDQRLELRTVEGLARLEVYQLSASFPGPVAPREFITLLITSENALSEASAPHVDSPEVPKTVPRHLILVSIPVTHPDAQPRDGLVRGQYESIEMIREIPLSDEEPELNPVEWIMVTRSDPGGGIPRFMVERNVPPNICSDAVKFLDWACGKDDFAEAEEVEDALAQPEPVIDQERKSIDSTRLSVVGRNANLAGVGTSIADNPPPSLRRLSSQRSQQTEESGLVNTFTNAVESYIPASIQSHIPDSLMPGRSDTSLVDREDSDSSTETSSIDSFASAEQFRTAEGEPLDSPDMQTSNDTTSTEADRPPPLSRHDSRYHRELAKIESQRMRLNERLARERERHQKNSEAASAKEQTAQEKARERHEREMKKQEEKFQREMKKLETKKLKEARKLEEKKRKEADKNTLAKTQRERDDYKARADIAEKENKLLKEQVGDLQRELTVLVARVGRMEGGGDVLRLAREEMEGKVSPVASRERGVSVDSKGSKTSKRSEASSLKTKAPSSGGTA